MGKKVIFFLSLRFEVNTDAGFQVASCPALNIHEAAETEQAAIGHLIEHVDLVLSTAKEEGTFWDLLDHYELLKPESKNHRAQMIPASMEKPSRPQDLQTHWIDRPIPVELLSGNPPGGLTGHGN